MDPLRFVFFLRAMADGVDRAVRPSRSAVTRDLRRVLAAMGEDDTPVLVAGKDEEASAGEDGLGQAYVDLRDKDGATLGMIVSWVADDVYACQGGDDEKNAKVIRAYRLLQDAARLLDEADITRP